jgi:hypothetical protein
VAWGIAATYLLVAIQVTSWLMRRVPRKVWHSVHLTSFLLFVSATVHGFTSGADNRNVAIQWACLTGGLLVFLLVVFRVLAPRKASRAASAARARVAARPDRSAETAAKVAALSEAVARVRGPAAAKSVQPNAATDTIGAAGGRSPSDPRNGLFEKLKMPPSEPTIR